MASTIATEDQGPAEGGALVFFRTSTGARGQAAFNDLVAGLSLWRLWTALGWIEILQRYRRSVLGPLWLTASMAIMVVSLGFLYSKLFRQDLASFMPFFCVGLLVWNFISSILNEAGGLFSAYDFFIKQVRLPYTIYVCRFVWSRTVMFAHNFVIYIAIAVYFGISPGLPLLAAVAGFILLLVNALAVSAYVGMISARFRDVPQIVTSATQVVFFLTPVLWKPELLGNYRFVADFNPLYHLIEIVRAPLLGGWPSLLTIAVVVAVTALNSTIIFVLFPRFRARIAYWV